MATTTLKAGMVWKGAYDASVTYDKLDVVCNADKTQIAVCKQGGSGIPLTNSNYWEVSIDASGIIALLEDALAHGEIYTMKIGSVTTGATSSATIVNNHQTHETILNLVLEKGEKGDKGDKGDRGEKGDTTVIDPSTATAYTLYNQTGNHTDGAMTQEAVTEEFEKLDEVYARNDGYYESMGVGMATNLKGQNVVDAEFTYRKSGGNVEVQDGNAMIEAIKGNTIAWNQILNTRKSTTVTEIGVTAVFDADGNVTISGTSTAGYQSVISLDFSMKIVENHKYYVNCLLNNVVGNYSVGTNTSTGFGKYNPNGAYICQATTTKNDTFAIYPRAGAVIPEQTFFPIIIDLTLIYGSGNEPSTPEQFEQDYFNWFGKPLTYEEYDAGSLRNTKVSALKTVGFNQWDEQWENGSFDTTTGVNFQSSGQIRSKNYIPVLSNKEYHCFFSNTVESQSFWMMFFDKNKNVLSDNVVGSIGRSNNVSDVLNVTFTTPNDCCYIRFYTKGTTYNNDICINISDPNRNGEYEPYKESTLPLDVTTLTGKLNGEGSSVVVFADGMNSAGNVHDEIKIENGVVKAIKRVGSVDLGSFGWTYYPTTGHLYFRAGLLELPKRAYDGITKANLICGLYENATGNDVYNNVKNKTCAIPADNDIVMIFDNSYSDASTFKSAMQGVMLYYELAEPEVYVLDDFNLPKLYPVANGGTEEQLSNSPNSLPATLSIRYGLNAAAFIQNAPKNYISKESMSNFLGNLGSAMGGTWSMTWNSSTNKYDFSFTQNRSVDVKQPIEDK